MQQVTRELVERILLSELALDTEGLKKFEVELRPMHAAMPNTEHGTCSELTPELQPTYDNVDLQHQTGQYQWYVSGYHVAFHDPRGESAQTLFSEFALPWRSGCR